MAKARGPKRSQSQFKEDKIEQQVNALIESISSTGRLPWRNIYDKSFKPFSASKYVAAYKRLTNKGLEPQEAAVAARKVSHYAGAMTCMSLWAEAMKSRRSVCATGTPYFFKEILPKEYPEYIMPDATYTGVKKGEKTVSIGVFFPVKRNEEESPQNTGNGTEGEKEEKTTMRFKAYNEIFVDQAVGINVNKFIAPGLNKENDLDEKNKLNISMLFDIADRLRVPLIEGLAGDCAKFVRRAQREPDGSIHMIPEVLVPPLQSFISSEEHLAAGFHEFSHACHYRIEPEAFDNVGKTGKFEGMNERQMDAYREVVAEFSAALMMIETDMVVGSAVENSANYVKGFLTDMASLSEAGKADMVYRASSMANRVMKELVDPDREVRVNIDQFIDKLDAERAAAIEHHNAKVADWSGKKPEELTGKDHAAFVNAIVDGFEPKVAKEQAAHIERNEKIQLDTGSPAR